MKVKFYVLLVAVLGLAPLASADQISRETFKVQTVADIVDLCSASRDSDIGKYAFGFCFGWLRGVDEFYDALLADKRFKIDPVSCPGRDLTYTETRDMFIAWAERTKGAMELPALEGLVRAAKDAYPCK